MLLAEQMEHVRSAAFNFLVPAGCAYDPPGQFGVATILANLITRGAGSRDSRALSLALDALGVDRGEGVRVMNINSLANAVKPAVLPGEELRVRVIQESKEAGQGVGFLDDGTMIVVEGGARHIDRDLDVSVTRVLQTVAGRMIFAQPRLD